MLSFIFGVLGNITTGLIYLVPVKTFWHIAKKRSTEKFGSAPYIFNLLNAYFWTYYGVVNPGSFLVATINGFGIVLGIIFVLIFLLFVPPKNRLRTVALAVTCNLIFPGGAISLSELLLDRKMKIQTAGILSAVFSMMAYGAPLSAMRTVIRTKSVEYMPFALSFIFFINGIMWTVYAVLTKDLFIGIPNGTGMGLAAIQLILYALYWKPNRVSPVDVGNGEIATPEDLEAGTPLRSDGIAPASISLHSHASAIVVFNGSNFSEWHEQVNFHLGVLDLDLALLVDKPPHITDMSSDDENSYHKAWARSNRLSLMFIRMTIASNIKATIPHTENAKEYLKFVEERFQSTKKSLATTLMTELTTIKFTGSTSMQDHIMDMVNIAARLKTLGMNVDDSFLVQFILNSLPSDYGPFKIIYNNVIKEKWDISDLSRMLTQEEARLQRQQGSNHFTDLVGKAWFEKRGIPYNPN